MIKLFKYFKLKDWALVLLSLLFIVAQVFLDLKLPEYIKEITLLITQPGGTVGAVWEQGLIMIAIALASAISAIVVGFFAARIAVSFAKTLREKLFNKVTSFSMAEINKFSTASLITRATNDTNQIERTVATGLQVIIKAPILATWAIFKILDKNWQWSAATAVSVGLILITMLVLLIFALPKVRKVQTIIDDLNKTTRETVSGVRVVRAYNANDYQQEKAEKVITKLSKTELFVGRLFSLISPVMMLVLNGLTLVIYWLGAHIINAASLPDKFTLFGDMMVFTSYAMQVIFAFIMIIMIFIILPRAIVSGKRINEVLDTETSLKDGTVKKGKKNLEGQVEFRDVSFKYPDAEESVIKNISFTAKKGQMVAFIGSTGSGKSTLINLVPRFYDVTSGEVLVSGVNVLDYTMEALHNKIGYVSQNSVLFSGTVEHNLKFGKSQKRITKKDMEKALEIAQGKDFVEKLEGGYIHDIAQGGTNLSGGQKQRISIARAIARKPEVLVFDDSFSALDYKTDKNLRKALKKEIQDTTVLVVAQRIGTIKNADKIIVLENGSIVGKGTHKELLKTCDVYKEIALSQFSEKELSNEIK